MNFKVKPKFLLFLIPMTALVLSFQNCGQFLSPQEFDPTTQLSSASAPTFSDLQKNILVPNCMSCHSSGTLDFSSYDAVMKSGTVIPYRAAQSSMYLQVMSESESHKSIPLMAEDKQMIYLWIQSGAADDNSMASKAPEAPLLSTRATLDGSVFLIWNFSTNTPVNSVRIERSFSAAGPFTLLATLNMAATTFTDLEVLPSTTYYYRLSTNYSDGTSNISNIATATTADRPAN